LSYNFLSFFNNQKFIGHTIHTTTHSDATARIITVPLVQNANMHCKNNKNWNKNWTIILLLKEWIVSKTRTSYRCTVPSKTSHNTAKVAWIYPLWFVSLSHSTKVIKTQAAPCINKAIAKLKGRQFTRI